MARRTTIPWTTSALYTPPPWDLPASKQDTHLGWRDIIPKVSPLDRSILQTGGLTEQKGHQPQPGERKDRRTTLHVTDSKVCEERTADGRTTQGLGRPDFRETKSHKRLKTAHDRSLGSYTSNSRKNYPAPINTSVSYDTTVANLATSTRRMTSTIAKAISNGRTSQTRERTPTPTTSGRATNSTSSPVKSPKSDISRSAELSLEDDGDFPRDVRQKFGKNSKGEMQQIDPSFQLPRWFRTKEWTRFFAMVIDGKTTEKQVRKSAANYDLDPAVAVNYQVLYMRHLHNIRQYYPDLQVS